MHITDLTAERIESEPNDASHLDEGVKPQPYPKILGNFIGKGDTKGCTFTELKRRGDVSLYLRQTPHGPTYEVVRVQTHKKDRYVSGKLIARAGDEFYPSSTSFGDKGWYYPERPQAEVKFKELTETPPILPDKHELKPRFRHELPTRRVLTQVHPPCSEYVC